IALPVPGAARGRRDHPGSRLRVRRPGGRQVRRRGPAGTRQPRRVPRGDHPPPRPGHRLAPGRLTPNVLDGPPTTLFGGRWAIDHTWWDSVVLVARGALEVGR